MQNENIKKLLMASVGMYLVYTGITLIRDVMISEPKNAVIFIGAGGIFVVIGLVAAVMNLKSYIGYLREMMAANTEESFADLEDEIESKIEENLFEDKFGSISVTIPERTNEKKETTPINLGAARVLRMENMEERDREIAAEEAEDLELEDIEDLEVTDEIRLKAEDAIDIDDEE